jgi:SAM-dependent methyltransferase
VKPAFYAEDLAYVHDAGFGALAREGGAELIRLLREAGVTRGRGVDLGCGSGIFSALLLAAGFEVEGCDASEAMIALARRRAPGARLGVGSLHDWPLPRASVIAALGEGLNYVAAADAPAPDLRSWFSRVAAALQPGGWLLFDVIVSGGGASLNARGWSAGDDWAVLVETSERPAERRLARDITVFRDPGSGWRRTREIHHVVSFDADELETWLRAAGFATEIGTRYGTYELAPRRRAFLARRLA